MHDLTIDRVQTRLLDVPLVRPHRFARTGMTAQPVMLLTITTSGGATGTGEGVVPGGPWWGGESVETMQLVVERYLAPVLLGRRVDDIDCLQRDLGDVVAGNLFAKAAVEVALHDAWARALGVPVHTLLGGLARTSVPVTWALGTEPAGEVVDEALAKLDGGGHTSFKLKMGAQEPAADVARVVEVAEKLRDSASVRVDLNARWDLATSLRWLPALADAGVDLVEQPVPAAEVDWLRQISADLRIPVMADESLRTPSDAFRLASSGAAGVFSVKTTKSGGLRRCAEITAIGAAAGVPCHAGTSIEGPVGTAATLHLACAAPGMTWGSELFGPLLMTEQLAVQPLRYADGHLHLPDGPGLGVDLDPAVVERLTRR
ncbi:chloromuconate cycloisomerase [Streptomyces sp. NP160]|uniref:muconate/chloromuconate family cycloisomerase n=1 Tax=Streptomyces sp. NP160 TaxID=2586637 RepID=UPI00111850D0|nr:muconate/chloromuconate family cycloisomerase [Streptomyces sp. NP160]TNM67602.1 chloromuconate cycloisomerase [Streptomyces sp. NP160]